MWAFSASVGLLPYLRLNGVLMALEGGGNGEVCDLGHGVKMGLKRERNGRWRDRWEDKLEGQNRKSGGTKLLPEHTVRV